MACKNYNAEISGHTVYVLQWPADKALEMQLRLLNVMGGASLPFVFGKHKFGDITRLAQLDKPVSEVLDIIKEFIYCARIDGKQISPAEFNFMFSGDLMLAYKIFGFVCEAQYKDFFTEGLEIKEEIEQEVTEKQS